MKPNQLRTFLAVVEQQSIRGAARLLSVSQPAVTNAMRELEADLGVVLLERSVSGVRLTPYGQAFEPRARFLLSEMRRTREELDEIREGNVGRVSLAASTSVALTLLPSAFREFRSLSPGIDVRLSEASLPTSLAKLRDGSVDIIVSQMMEPSQSEFHITPLYSSPLVVAVRSGHSLARSRSLRELSDAEWLLPYDRETAPHLLELLFAAQGATLPKRIVQCTSTAMGLRLVGTQDLIGVFLETLAQTEFKHYGIKRLKLREPLQALVICIITRRDSQLTPAAQRFFDCIRRQALLAPVSSPDAASLVS
ncbi:LysR family transcriptional regulator [Caballeronia udeis]|uniref:LysR family transcriptional regulator n=1 Tax=Caballeronia udeis TaxID=1232866 RepID=A0A158JCY6_9BURK|nr:LysR family transcriptional regulator [Caballeronia udeis]SAL66555.1 LysR family transcriptional regulator [Caballeronia udeis]